MSKRLRRIILSIVFVILFSFGLLWLYKILSWKDTSGDYFSSVKELSTLPENTVEAVAFGSSRAYGSFNPAIMWDEFGYATFDFAISGMAQESAYYHLKELLKTQSPKVVFMEGSLLTTEGYLDKGNQYRNSIVMKPSKNNYDLIKTTADEGEEWDYLLRFPIVHNRYSELKKGDFTASNTDLYRLGYVAGFDIEPQSVDDNILDSKDSIEVSEITKAWIDKLYELSIKEDFTLVFYYTPQNLIQYYKSVYNGACEYLDKYGIEHIDFNEIRKEVGIDYSTDLSDAGHMNTYGAKKVTRFLGNYLSDNFSLTDYRSDKSGKYERWDMCSLYYQHEWIDNGIKQIEEYDELLKESVAKDNLVVAAFDGKQLLIYDNGEIIGDSLTGSFEFAKKINSSDYYYANIEVEDNSIKSIVINVGQKAVNTPLDTNKWISVYDCVTDSIVMNKLYE